MTKINDLSQGNLGDMARQQRRDRYATPLNGSSIGSGGMRFYGTGKLRVENVGLEVSGTATITGTLNADGTVNLTGIVGITGPLTVTGTTALNGPTTLGMLITSDMVGIVGTTVKISGLPTTTQPATGVAAGKKITLGSLVLENQSATSGQVQFPGGEINASTALRRR